MSITPVLICSLAVCQAESALSASTTLEVHTSAPSTIEQVETTAYPSEIDVEPEISSDDNRSLVVPPENLAIPRFSPHPPSSTELLEETIVLENNSGEASVHLETENEEVLFSTEFLSMGAERPTNNSIEDATQISIEQLSRENSLQEPTEIRFNDSESSLDGIRNIPREVHLLSELPQEETLDDGLGEVIPLTSVDDDNEPLVLSDEQEEILDDSLGEVIPLTSVDDDDDNEPLVLSDEQEETLMMV